MEDFLAINWNASDVGWFKDLEVRSDTKHLNTNINWTKQMIVNISWVTISQCINTIFGTHHLRNSLLFCSKYRNFKATVKFLETIHR